MSRKFINLATLQRLHTYAITDFKKTTQILIWPFKLKPEYKMDN